MQENSQFQSENAPVVASEWGKKERANAFLLSLVAVFLSIVISGVFHGLAFITNNSINSVNETINEQKNKIHTLESDKKNTVASIISQNDIAPSIALGQLLSEFRNTSIKYDVMFQNFSVKDDTISSNLVATNDDKDAAQKIIHMMEEFAKTGQQGTFSLEPISSISGDRNTRNTQVTFKIVPPKATTPSEEKPSSESSN